MPLYPSKLEAGEEYASVSDIMDTIDLPEATIKIPHWRKNGKPMAVRVRALSILQREAIQKESTGKDGTVNHIAEIEATWREGCVTPKFDLIQAARLRHKNGAALEQGAAFIWSLSLLDQEMIDATVQALAGAPPAPDAG